MKWRFRELNTYEKSNNSGRHYPLMLTQKPIVNIGFVEVIRTTRYKYVYSLLMATIFGGFMIALVLTGLSPVQINEVTDHGEYAFEVKESTEPPIELDISHSFPISVSGNTYHLTEGPSHIVFSVKIEKNGGRPILNKTSSLDIPAFIQADHDQSSYVVSEDEDMDLSSGTYTITISSDHPVTLQLIQKNRLQLPLMTSSVISFLGIVILVGVVISTFKKRDSMRASRFFAAMVSNTPTNSRQSSTRLFYSVPEYPRSTTNLSGNRVISAPGSICEHCGNIIQNPVVQNVITCEKCGEKEYVGK
jgi:hypothetical protein